MSMDLSSTSIASSELHRYAEALLVHLAADGSAPELPPGTVRAAARAAGPAVSSSGAWARRAELAAAARPAGLPGLATTTTGAEANNRDATPAATTSGAPASTDVGGTGTRVRAVMRTCAGGPCRVAAPVQDAAPPTAATSMSAAPAARAIPVCLLARIRSTRHPRSASAGHSSQGPRHRAAGRRPFRRHNTVRRA